MKIMARAAGGISTLSVSGEVDLESADALIKAVVEALQPGVTSLRIELAGVSFMDSTGLSALVAIRNMSEGAGIGLVLSELPRSVERIVQITGLDRLFAIE